jgi:hypothetical protein
MLKFQFRRATSLNFTNKRHQLRDSPTLERVKMSSHDAFSPSSLTPFDLTHVVHAEGDALGFLFALSALVPIFLIVAYVTAIVCRREIAILVALVGQLANEVLNSLVKGVVKEARPFRGFLA